MKINYTDSHSDGYGDLRGDGESPYANDPDDVYTSGRGNGGGIGWHAGDGTGWPSGGGTGYSDYDADGDSSGVGRGDGICCSWSQISGNGTSSNENLLTELGIPKHLQNLFLPFNQDNMLTARDFIQAETQEQKDAILGMLELRHEN